MDFALGKKAHKADARTLRLGQYMELPRVPAVFDFDNGRSPFPLNAWGNNEWGDCVEVGKYNGLVRLERVETRRTIQITTNDVVAAYKMESVLQNGHAPARAGDQFDEGLVILDSLNVWRKQGQTVAARPKQAFKIAAFGEANRFDRLELRAACYLLHGIYFGLNLPLTALDQIEEGNGQAWDLVRGSERSLPGSWGGHCVYAKSYDTGGFTCLTWGQPQYMTNAFIEAYADEAWAVVDSLDTAKVNKNLDVAGMLAWLRKVAVHVQVG